MVTPRDVSMGLYGIAAFLGLGGVVVWFIGLVAINPVFTLAPALLIALVGRVIQWAGAH